jgi:hypothetical protein
LAFSQKIYRSLYQYDKKRGIIKMSNPVFGVAAVGNALVDVLAQTSDA